MISQIVTIVIKIIKKIKLSNYTSLFTHSTIVVMYKHTFTRWLLKPICRLFYSKYLIGHRLVFYKIVLKIIQKPGNNLQFKKYIFIDASRGTFESYIVHVHLISNLLYRNFSIIFQVHVIVLHEVFIHVFYLRFKVRFNLRPLWLECGR